MPTFEASSDSAEESRADHLLSTLMTSPSARFSAVGDIEVHTLVSHDHLPLYLFAVKSLAHFWNAVAPVVHDDGTLSGDDLGLLRDHVPEVRVITRADADAQVADLLGGYPLLAAIRANNVRILQLLDYFLLSDARTVVGMDSDVVFLREPSEIIRWCADQEDEADFLYSPEEGWEPMGVNWIADELPGTDHITYMCCGFTCTRPESFLDLDFLTATLEKLPDRIRFAPRYVTQMCYSLLGGRLPAGGARSLGEPYRSGRLEWLPDIPDRAICHYMASHERETCRDNLVEDFDLLSRTLHAASASR